MKKMTKQVIFLLLGALIGCSTIPTPRDIATRYQQKVNAAAKQELDELSKQRRVLMTQYETCKSQEQKLMKHLNESEMQLYRIARERFQEDYLQIMMDELYGQTPALVTLSNPKGLSVEWWNFPQCYRIRLRIARKDRERFLSLISVSDLKEEINRLIQREYHIRDQADDIFFREQSIKQRLRSLPSEVLEIQNTSLTSRTQSSLNPQQEAMLKLILDEQAELLHRPQTVREWWEYQEAFGFDDYKRPR
jgi:chromosome segregation ATPase